MSPLYDSHCHLDAEAFDADRGQVLARARAAGVTRQLVPAVDRASWDTIAALCAADPGLRPAWGLHPMYLARHQPAHLDELADWLASRRPAAVGEFGLDYFVEGLDPEAQRLYFRRQLELAREFDLPVVLHARRAVDEVIAALRRVGGLRGVVHSWSGSEEQARQLFALGFCLGIGGPVTYERARRLRRTVAAMPADCLLLETDAPDQPDAGRRGQRNEPGFLPTVLETVAALRGEPVERVAETTTANALRLFG
ncbi:TatD family hydrolase [Arenimonas caeni]|jgi:TatD DNase family protein|uniref:DNAase n=1 Tax=Arenimonas caeni TaxID=2058085 RepID=A0A2P6MBC2_9GAMM|nr:TatD family hydrolase [Arenimonas caeni]MDY0021347.1 TatD family hydrolase [Arenimonas caeni]PRH83284.1 DNAase [Arenimonas caeni]